MPSLLRQLQDGRLSEKGAKKMEPSFERKALHPLDQGSSKAVSSSSKARETTHREFLAATAKSWDQVYTNQTALPNLESAFASFKEIYPRYSETLAIEALRVQEYAHLEESSRICLDYCGFGLFSYLQQFEDWESASFALSSLSVNLCSHALFGAAKEGTVECDIRKRIMNYLNIQDTDYSMVFTASRGASFKLLADAYPFGTSRRLVTMYDYESESLGWLVQRAKEKGAKVSDVSFKWPSLRIISTKLRKQLIAKGRRRKGSAVGLFVFPAQSRVSGAKYSYQWMSLAQKNKWHVLLDASALGPKDMDSLGLSMFKPDFIVASFYKVFGADPSGFGCLFIKSSAMQSVQNQSGAAAPGIVRIIPFPQEWSSSESSTENPEEADGPVAPEGDEEEEITDFEFPMSNQLIQGVPSFSGPMLGFDKFSSPEERTGGAYHGKEEGDDDSSVCDSAGEVSRSPVFSEEGTENLFCLDVGTSPAGSASRTSLSDDQFSGPFSGPIHNPVCDGHFKSHGPSGLRNPLYEDDGSCDVGLKAKESMEASVAMANGKHHAVIDSVPRVSRPAEEGSWLLANGDADDKRATGYCASPESKLCVQSAQGHNSNETNSISNVVVGCEQLKNQIGCKEIEMIEDSLGVAKAEELAEQKYLWNQSESAIRRETEGDFRLLGRRESSRLMLGHSLSPLQSSEVMGSFAAGRSSFVSAERAVTSFDSEGGSSDFGENEHDRSEEEVDEQGQSEDRDPEIICRSLDHADMLGLNKSTLRHRCLINWLVSSLLQLQHPGVGNGMPLVHIYGPKIKYDRGASVAFNLYDCHGKLIHPEIVQMLADKSNLSLSIGFLKNLQVSENDLDLYFFGESRKTTKKGSSKGRMALRMEVVTAALSILSSFEDVYKLRLFVARFLDADFVMKELGGS